MKDAFWMSGEIEGDVYDDYNVAQNEIEPAINSALKGNEFGRGFVRLSLIPIMLPEDDPDYDEIRRYHKKDRDFEFRLKIPHAVFKAASPLGQRRLVMQNILRAVDEMRKMRVKDVDCDKLEQAIREVAVAHDWLGDPPTLH